jgi:hypothetical protein
MKTYESCRELIQDHTHLFISYYQFVQCFIVVSYCSDVFSLAVGQL